MNASISSESSRPVCLRRGHLGEGEGQREDAEADERAEDVEAGLGAGAFFVSGRGLRGFFDDLVSGRYVRVEVEAAELVGDFLFVLGRVVLEALVVHLHRRPQLLTRIVGLLVRN